MMTPIRLNTAHGQEQFLILQDQFNKYSDESDRRAFQERCREDHLIQSKYLEYFLDDPDMSNKYPMHEDDVEGFKIFNEQSDVVASLNYFANRKV